MTRRELLTRFPNAKESFLRLNADPEPSTELPSPKPERPVLHDPLAAGKGKEGRPARALKRVAITCFRCRLQDSDNCCVKYLVDALRHEKLIADDSPDHIILEVRQEKVATKSEEGTLIEIWQK